MIRLGGWFARFTGNRNDARPLGSAPVPVVRGEESKQAQEALSSGLASLARGELQAAEAAFEQAVESSHDLAAAHHALGRLRLDQDRFEDAADSLQLAVLFDPQCAAAHAELALALARTESNAAARAAADRAAALAGSAPGALAACARAYKAIDALEPAARCYERALAIEPRSAELACQLGYIHYLSGDYAAAREAYARSLDADRAHVPALHNLGLLDLETGYPEPALERFEQACALRRSPQSLACIGHALRDLGRLSDACAAYERVLAEHPDCGDARINFSYALLMRGDLEAGWAQYERRFEATGTPVRDFGLPLWRGEPLAGRRLLIFAEQGLGDEIMFASCIPDALALAADALALASADGLARAGVDARAGGCVVECNTRLAALFSRSFPQAHVHGGEKSDEHHWLSSLAGCDFQIPVGSLPRHLRRTPAAFDTRDGYLVADSARVAHWRGEIGGDARKSIGFAWRGGALRTRQWLRSVPLEQWAELLRVPACRFVALQHGDHGDELNRVSVDAGAAVTDLSHVCADIDELAAVVCALDLVVTVDNTLAHLSAALGRPTWVLLPAAPEWRYPRAGECTPWFKSMRLFRQSAPRDASTVMRQVIDALRSERRGIDQE